MLWGGSCVLCIRCKNAPKLTVQHTLLAYWKFLNALPFMLVKCLLMSSSSLLESSNMLMNMLFAIIKPDSAIQLIGQLNQESLKAVYPCSPRNWTPATVALAIWIPHCPMEKCMNTVQLQIVIILKLIWFLPFFSQSFKAAIGN